MENIANHSPVSVPAGVAGTGVRPPANPYTIDKKDSIVAIPALIIGFLFWEWKVFIYYAPTLGTFILLMSAITITFAYFGNYFSSPAHSAQKSGGNKHGIGQNKRGWFMLLLTLVSACYFLIFDNTPLHFFMLLFAILSYVMWVAVMSGTVITKKLNGFILGDILNQLFSVPFCNLTALFRSLLGGEKSQRTTFLHIVIGIVISIPLLSVVMWLLMQVDERFMSMAEQIYENILNESFISYFGKFLAGIPVACYCFGFIYGNRHLRKVDKIKYHNMSAGFIKLHAIPKPTVYGPLLILNIIYLVFFVSMGGYLFSAFSGNLPETMTYAEYARRGFFELCILSSINLIVVIFAYTFTRRLQSEYPRSLRFLTGTMSAFTILLTGTAMSKLIMYVSSYGLTRLRLYTLWFTILLMFMFILILIWHIKRFNIGKPLIIGFVALFLALSFGNPDGIIARYNIDAYEKGSIEELDIYTLAEMSDAVVPYIKEARDRTKDQSLKDNLNEALIEKDEYGKWSIEWDGEYPNSPLRFNIQSHIANGYE